MSPLIQIFLALSLASFAFAASPAAPSVAVVIGPNAPALERQAASYLVAQLQNLFGAQTAILSNRPASEAALIFLGNPESNPGITDVMGGAWPNLSAQGHLIKSVRFQGRDALVLGGGSPVATRWAVHEFGYRCGIRHLLFGDFAPLMKPVFSLAGYSVTLEPHLAIRAWSAFNGQPFGAEAWQLQDHQRLLAQLSKLKFTHVIVPANPVPFPPIRVDGDVPGRKVFAGARQFENSTLSPALLRQLTSLAADYGITVTTNASLATRVHPGPTNASVLPHFNLEFLATELRSLPPAPQPGFSARVHFPGDLNASLHFLSRAAFHPGLSASQSLTDLATPICGPEVDDRLAIGFAASARAAELIDRNDPLLGVPDARMIARQSEAREAQSTWMSEVKALYTQAMNEMYRANTRARDGARPFILYHAKRFEFALHLVTSLEAVRKAGQLRAQGQQDAAAKALEPAIEAMYNALNALADVARDPSDRGTIAALNEHGYRPLLKLLELYEK